MLKLNKIMKYTYDDDYKEIDKEETNFKTLYDIIEEMNERKDEEFYEFNKDLAISLYIKDNDYISSYRIKYYKYKKYLLRQFY